ncbi:chloride channel protein [Legionella oakridgensis]|uniref:Chloride channel protein EriC n=2 Tax=Legionella oakridgensis TaxID=29423 RepID=W0BFM8_9GAMM|nr:chloride channel protein [Legionella oakridgensis]AHE67432.1 chloride channel protein EriC [Legionella oakridgensis ATCC 33761 = DSM 21215]ETO92964.1 chloride channel protein EriC [Legionella oakridgensis RV-2-2007]KTD43492.1 chloride channel protein (voltage gated) [Legionella oakridgensis]STY20484.1 chloride channel protein (voltage gated) [Legionella longbeachae]
MKTNRIPVLIGIIILVGISSGFAGMLLALLLRSIQHLAYGYSPLQIVSNETFLEGVRAASPQRRFLILTLCGVIAGGGWWLLHRYGNPLVSVGDAVKNKISMPKWTTIIHALLQIITIALGSPLGRETAPREMSAVFAEWLSAKAGLSIKDTQIMVACGAGAGFAAVYNVPLGGALFILEVLLCTLNWSILIPAFATSTIAVVVSWIGLGNHSQYALATYHVSHSLTFWSILSSPVFGLSAFWYIRIANLCRHKAPRGGWSLPLLCLLNFIIIGVLAMYFPAILGNGKSPVQLEFDDEIGVGISCILLILRLLITWSSLRAGSYGGLLTPSLANGALLGVILGGLWNTLWPGSSMNAFSVVGATAFLAAAQKMPITAIVLMFEFTHMKLSFLVPLLFAVTGSIATFRLCSNQFAKSS